MNNYLHSKITVTNTWYTASSVSFHLCLTIYRPVTSMPLKKHSATSSASMQERNTKPKLLVRYVKKIQRRASNCKIGFLLCNGPQYIGWDKKISSVSVSESSAAHSMDSQTMARKWSVGILNCLCSREEAGISSEHAVNNIHWIFQQLRIDSSGLPGMQAITNTTRTWS